MNEVKCRDALGTASSRRRPVANRDRALWSMCTCHLHVVRMLEPALCGGCSEGPSWFCVQVTMFPLLFVPSDHQSDSSVRLCQWLTQTRATLGLWCHDWSCVCVQGVQVCVADCAGHPCHCHCQCQCMFVGSPGPQGDSAPASSVWHTQTRQIRTQLPQPLTCVVDRGFRMRPQRVDTEGDRELHLSQHIILNVCIPVSHQQARLRASHL